MTRDEIDARWQKLDPVFVRGMQRSGTSAMARALQEMEILGFGEGHLWFELAEPLDRIIDPSHCPALHDPSYTLGSGRDRQLIKYLALCLDQFHRDHLPAGFSRWMDKSPGAYPIVVAPLLADLFPLSQFIFLRRNGITVVHSGMRFWDDDPETFEMLCQGWTETMTAWRKARKELVGRYIEIEQSEMATEPYATALRLTEFLGQSDAAMKVFQVFATKRVLPAFPDKGPGDYRYKVDWSPTQRTKFESICGEEMAVWGYELDFETSGVSRGDVPASRDLDAIVAQLQQSESKIADLERECSALRGHLCEVESGRVMRLLNRMESWRSRLALRSDRQDD